MKLPNREPCVVIELDNITRLGSFATHIQSGQDAAVSAKPAVSRQPVGVALRVWGTDVIHKWVSFSLVN
jgi:hypothetical protein